MKEKPQVSLKTVLSLAAPFAFGLTLVAGNAVGTETEVQLELERSTDLRDWDSVPLTGDMLSEDGKVRLAVEGTGGFFRLRVETGEAVSDMVVVEGGTLSAISGLGELDVSTFEISPHAVTWEEWKAIREWAVAEGYDIGDVGEGCTDEHPVHDVNWYDVIKWCNAKSEMEGLAPVYSVDGSVYRKGSFGAENSDMVDWNVAANGYRLPSEAEWEFAARGGTQSEGYTYSGSDDMDEVGWHSGNSEGAACMLVNDKGPWPVGRKKAPNELGLYDMSGNVWEWCWDASGSDRRIRGGSWVENAAGSTVWFSVSGPPDSRYFISGFRLARNSEF